MAVIHLARVYDKDEGGDSPRFLMVNDYGREAFDALTCGSASGSRTAHRATN